MRQGLPLVIFTCIFLCACKREEPIQTYRVAKETPAPPAKGRSTRKPIEWKTPLGWKEQPASAMRVGSFLVSGRTGQLADVSIIPLSGEAGGSLANINRWRGQINLGPITEETLEANSETISPNGRSMILISFVSEKPLLDSRYRKRVMAAIYDHKRTTWFFKVMGDDQTVQEIKPAFMQFLNSLRFNDSPV